MRPRWFGSRAGRTARSGDPSPLTASDRNLGRLTVGLAAVATAVALWSVHAAMPANAIQLPLESSHTMQLLLPQGWAFFTASPATLYPQAYELAPGGRWASTGGSLAVPDDLFGLDRSKRAQGTEIALLLQSVKTRDWRNCSVTPTECLSRAPIATHLVNTSTLQNVCGDVGIVQQQPLPWAWRGSDTAMPSQVVRVEVACHQTP